MSQTPPPNRLAAMKDDGFIDFYELIGVEDDATLTRLRTTINALYNEAQANRDHRNLNRRREYQTLLQLLPQARELLLEEKQREHYDAFREEHRSGVTTISFESWAHQLHEKASGSAGKSAVLGVQGEEKEVAKSPTASVTKVPLEKPRPKPKPRSRVVVEGSAPGPETARSSLLGTVISMIVGFAFFVLLNFVLKIDFSWSLITGVIACVIVFIITHRKSTNKTAL